MEWWEECISDIQELLDYQCSCNYIESDNEDILSFIQVRYKGNFSLFEYRDELESIASKHNMSLDDFDDDSVDFVVNSY